MASIKCLYLSKKLSLGMTVSRQHFKSFYLAHFRAVAGFCRSLVGDEEEALDMAQEAFCRLWQKWSPEYTEANAQAFIYITAKNLCLDRLRRARFKQEELAAAEGMPVSEGTMLEEIIRQETVEAVRRAVETLTGRGLQVVRMTMEGKTNPEIAAELGVSVNTVKFAKKEAYAKLRERLENEYMVLLAWEILAHLSLA